MTKAENVNQRTSILPDECLTPGMPHCPDCGYTRHDAAFHKDHGRCRGKIPPDSNYDSREVEEKEL